MIGIAANQKVSKEAFGLKFYPAFYGECNIGRGSKFGPQGGRMFFVLSPNHHEIMRFLLI